jgi:hypothetical protein
LESVDIRNYLTEEVCMDIFCNPDRLIIGWEQNPRVPGMWAIGISIEECSELDIRDIIKFETPPNANFNRERVLILIVSLLYAILEVSHEIRDDCGIPISHFPAHNHVFHCCDRLTEEMIGRIEKHLMLCESNFLRVQLLIQMN